jgi:hypothetical protein
VDQAYAGASGCQISQLLIDASTLVSHMVLLRICGVFKRYGNIQRCYKIVTCGNSHPKCNHLCFVQNDREDRLPLSFFLIELQVWNKL